MVSPNYPAPMFMYKVTYSSTSVNWASQIACITMWASTYSGSMLSEDKSIIYLYFMFGTSSSYIYLYFAALSASTGASIGTRYKSSTYMNYVFGSILKGDYILVTTDVPNSLVIYSLSASTFIIKTFANKNYCLGIEPSSGR